MDPRSTRSSANTAPGHRLRILSRGDETELIREMREIGVDPAGISLMAPKGELRVVRLEDLSPWQANLLKQEMLSIGGDTAVHRGSIDCSAGRTGALLLGTRKHFRLLCEKLAEQPSTLRQLGEEISTGLERWQRRRFTVPHARGALDCGARTLVMGIVNVTPDSFSDGGAHFPAARAAAHGAELLAAGADVVDVGGESSRPGAEPVPLEEERRRVVPVIERLARIEGAVVSVDTCKAAVAEEAMAAGAAIINDISALGADPRMGAVAAATGAGLVLMHMQGTPRTMQAAPRYDDLMGEIVGHLRGRMAAAAAAGVDPERIIVDPGIGFGKTLEHNVALLRHLGQLRVLGRPVLVGPSRKSFIGALAGGEPDERLEGTIAAAVLAVREGAQVVRVHDVAAVGRALRVADAICGRGA